MEKITIKGYWTNIPAKGIVASGYGYELQAPSEEGTYTLYQLVNKNNTHAGWQWSKEN